MLKRKALMESVSANLHGFLKIPAKTCHCRTGNSCVTPS